MQPLRDRPVDVAAKRRAVTSDPLGTCFKP